MAPRRGAAAYNSSKTESMNTACSSGDSGQRFVTPMRTGNASEHALSTRMLLLTAVYTSSHSPVGNTYPDTPSCRAVFCCTTETMLWSILKGVEFNPPWRGLKAYCRSFHGVTSTSWAVNSAKNNFSLEDMIVGGLKVPHLLAYPFLHT